MNRSLIMNVGWDMMFGYESDWQRLVRCDKKEVNGTIVSGVCL